MGAFLAGLIVLALALPAVAADDARLILFQMDESGSSHLLQGPGFTVIVDTGTPDSQWRLVDELNSRGVDRVDLLILTHPHSDHIGQAVDLLEALPVARVWTGNHLPEFAKDLAIMRQVEEAIEASDADHVRVRVGDSLTLGELTLKVLWPNELATSYGSHQATNADSIVTLATFGDSRILLPGDALYDTEQQLIDSGLGSVDVLVLGHHGATDATSERWLDALTPAVAVYSRLHSESWTMAKLAERGIPVYGTHSDGTITVDLNDLTVSTSESAYPSAGNKRNYSVLGLVAAGGLVGLFAGWVLFRDRDRVGHG